MSVHDLKPVPAATGFFLVQRIKAPSADWALQADFTTIALKVVPEAGGDPTFSAELTIDDVIFDELQVDNYWLNPDGSYIDNVGYNFRYPTIASQIPNANTAYLYKLKFTPPEGQPFVEIFRVRTLKAAF